MNDLHQESRPRYDPLADQCDDKTEPLRGSTVSTNAGANMTVPARTVRCVSARAAREVWRSTASL
jgi:hypothetical protein